MVEYKIVKYCRMCRVRFTVGRRDSKMNFCEKCQKRVDKERAEAARSEKNDD